MNFSSLNVRTKLSLAFGLLAALVLLVTLLALKAQANAQTNFAHFTAGVNARGQLADQVRSAVDRRAIAARNLIMVRQAEDIASEHAAVVKAHEDVQSRLSLLKKMVSEAADTTPRARALIDEFDKIEQSYGPVALSIVNLALDKKYEEATQKVNAECRPLLQALVSAARNFRSYTTESSKAVTEESAAHYVRERNILAVICLLAFVAAVAAGVAITRSLRGALGAEPADLGNVAQRIASGDLSPIAEGDRAPKGSVLASLVAMQQNLASIVGQVRGASDSIATGSAQIATGNADLSQRTEEQASALQQTASTMDELSATVRNNADNARQANQLAGGASSVATQGGEVVTQVVQTMKGINESSRKIGDIIGVIDGIAFQTNILALNAAVEAARAGEQGRGFAVVASEVRTLAKRSADAAKEIKSLIGNSVDQVEQGTVLVDSAGRTMQEIVSAIKRVSDIVAEISSASVEQSAGVSQIGLAIGQMEQVTQQNAALVEESAAAASSLEQQATQLVKVVGSFRLGHDA